MVIYLISYECRENQTIKPDVFCTNETETGLSQLIDRLADVFSTEPLPRLWVWVHDLPTQTWERCHVEKTDGCTAFLVRDSDDDVVAEFTYCDPNAVEATDFL
jgi:hypothetical protein